MHKDVIFFIGKDDNLSRPDAPLQRNAFYAW